MRDIKAIRDRIFAPRPSVTGGELQLIEDGKELLAEIEELNAQIRILQSNQAPTASYQTGG